MEIFLNRSTLTPLETEQSQTLSKFIDGLIHFDDKHEVIMTHLNVITFANNRFRDGGFSQFEFTQICNECNEACGAYIAILEGKKGEG